MKDKKILLLIVVNIFLLAGCQATVKQSVKAETLESSSLQQEMNQSEPILSSLEGSNESEESAPMQVSSIKEERKQVSESSEGSESSVVNESSTDLAKATEGSKEEIAKVVQPPVTSAKVEENYQFSVVKNQTTDEFIQTIGKDAQQIAWDNGLYASVMIAQAILETGSGNSHLGRPPYHNLFGIKGSYQGKEVSFNTQEDKGNGQLYTINSAFRQYPRYKESLEDYAALLKNGLSGNPGFYQGTWKEHAATYQEAAKSLTGKYATDTSYDKKLNALVETYELTSFDQEPNKEKETSSDSSETINTQQTTKESTSSDSYSSGKKQSIVSETRQEAVVISPITQRPAKQVAGNQIVE
ncbi:glucosaminidase domain-containing protein [Enterococcus sp. 669A]|uniref:Glucosaminidase domain-containing protein n=1 Tax=Candidatus Enterococcus moelleringii TaxID=2815325 RepID=A0ABS3L701_9ENTE|nr:glucosaminidase domain-containing protein [Enterococcus sp. 669A]MBO1305396.1 glucosaminidase domain-containing protein [Enterococcus sp. 669A]